MRLRDLDAEFIRTTGEKSFRRVDMLAEAEGVMFLCPLCFKTNGGPVGTHRVICWTPAVGPERQPRPGRWSLHGTSIDDLTLNGSVPGGARSVLLTDGCGWHGFITNGQAEGGF